MSAIPLLIKGQKYLATFVEATDGFGPYYRVVRQEKPTDNLRGGYIVRVDEGGRPLRCTCPDCHRHSDANSVKQCKHMKAIYQVWLDANVRERRRLQELALRTGAVVSRVPLIAQGGGPDDPVVRQTTQITQTNSPHQRAPEGGYVCPGEKTAPGTCAPPQGSGGVVPQIAQTTQITALGSPADTIYCPFDPDNPFARLGD